jgi:hypothetical protein
MPIVYLAQRILSCILCLEFILVCTRHVFCPNLLCVILYEILVPFDSSGLFCKHNKVPSKAKYNIQPPPQFAVFVLCRPGVIVLNNQVFLISLL